MSSLKFYVGHDSREPEISHVCYSSMRKWLQPTDVKLLRLMDILDVYTRVPDPTQATEFSFSRFLVPYLNNFEGWAVFCDGDFLWVDDPSSLAEFCDPNYAVLCVQHDIKPHQLTPTKMGGKVQNWYPRKNWSSLMLINCSHPLTKQLTPELINKTSGSFLHHMKWAQDKVGSLPLKYNFLVGYYPRQENVCAYHFTDGVPIHQGYEESEYSDLWKAEHARITV